MRLPVTLGGNDYAFAPPAAPSSRTDHLSQFDRAKPVRLSTVLPGTTAMALIALAEPDRASRPIIWLARAVNVVRPAVPRLHIDRACFAKRRALKRHARNLHVGLTCQNMRCFRQPSPAHTLVRSTARSAQAHRVSSVCIRPVAGRHCNSLSASRMSTMDFNSLVQVALLGTERQNVSVPHRQFHSAIAIAVRCQSARTELAAH